MSQTRTDAERLDCLEKMGNGIALIEDDNGHWAVTGDGSQTLPDGEGPQDIWTSFVVEAGKWKGSVREAINAFIDGGEFE